MDLVKALNSQYMKEELPEMRVGDTVRVHVRIKEGSRERIQVFEGTIIARKHGGIGETITVRRISYGVGCEKVSLFTLLMLQWSRLSVRVRFAVQSCTICVTVWARLPRSRRESNTQLNKKRGETLSFYFAAWWAAFL